jgi:hypothetical protein
VILLSTTGSLLELVTGGAQAVHVVASWVDASGLNVDPDGLNTQISAIRTTTIVPSPAASSQRNIKYLSICNTDASSAVDIAVKHFDGTTTVVLQPLFPLLAGQTLFYEDAKGWYLQNQAVSIVRLRPS